MTNTSASLDNAKIALQCNDLRRRRIYDSVLIVAVSALPILVFSATLLIQKPSLPAWACLAFGAIIISICAFVGCVIAYFQHCIPDITEFDNNGIHVRGWLSVTYIVSWDRITSIDVHRNCVVLVSGHDRLPVVWRYVCHPEQREAVLHFINESMAGNKCQ